MVLLCLIMDIQPLCPKEINAFINWKITNSSDEMEASPDNNLLFPIESEVQDWIGSWVGLRTHVVKRNVSALSGITPRSSSPYTITIQSHPSFSRHLHLRGAIKQVISLLHWNISNVRTVMVLHACANRESLVGTATGYGLDVRGLIPERDKRFAFTPRGPDNGYRSSFL
jgi:hypothetical protein